MNEEEIKKLRKKREKLQDEYKYKERVATEIAHLEKIKCSYILHYEAKHLNWIHSNVSVSKKDGYKGILGDFQIDVDDTKALSECKMTEDEIDSDKFSEMLSSFLTKDSQVVICHLGGDPELEISSTAFLSKPTVFFSNPENWVITTERNFIIEYLWEQGVIRLIELQNSNPILVKKIIIDYPAQA